MQCFCSTNAQSEKLGSKASEGKVCEIRESVPKQDRILKEVTCSSTDKSLECEMVKRNGSLCGCDGQKKAHIINALQLTENITSLQLVTDKRKNLSPPLPYSPSSANPSSPHAPSQWHLDVFHCRQISFVMLRTMASILPYGKDGKPGHPEREVSKACLHFLIALFSATRKICLIYAQPESGQPRTLGGSHRDGLVSSQTLYFLEKGTQGIIPRECLLHALTVST